MSNNLEEGEGFPPLTPEEMREIKEAEKIIKKSKKLNPKEKRYAKSQREKQREYEIVSRFLSEYLDTYVLLGYTTSSEEFVTMKYNSPLERRALTHLIDEFFAVHFDSMTNSKNDEEDEDQEEEDEE